MRILLTYFFTAWRNDVHERKLSKFKDSVEGRQFAGQGASAEVVVSFGGVRSFSDALDALLPG